MSAEALVTIFNPVKTVPDFHKEKNLMQDMFLAKISPLAALTEPVLFNFCNYGKFW